MDFCHREQLTQQTFDQSLIWDDFPVKRIAPGAVIYRFADIARDAKWWYSSLMQGRFDLKEPRGTCYAATRPEIGVLELLCPNWCLGAYPRLIAHDPFATKAIYQRTLISGLTLANLAHRRTIEYRISNELSTVTPYEVTQEHAGNFDSIFNGKKRRRFGGIFYRTRYETGGPASGLALFGSEGIQEEETQGQEAQEYPIDDEIRRLVSLFFVRHERPSLRDMRRTPG